MQQRVLERLLEATSSPLASRLSTRLSWRSDARKLHYTYEHTDTRETAGALAMTYAAGLPSGYKRMRYGEPCAARPLYVSGH